MTPKQKKLVETYIRKEVRKRLNEGNEVDLWEKIEKPFENLRNAILDLKNSSENIKWKSALGSLNNDLDNFESKVGEYSRKLGIIILK